MPEINIDKDTLEKLRKKHTNKESSKVNNLKRVERQINKDMKTYQVYCDTFKDLIKTLPTYSSFIEPIMANVTITPELIIRNILLSDDCPRELLDIKNSLLKSIEEAMDK